MKRSELLSDTREISYASDSAAATTDNRRTERYMVYMAEQRERKEVQTPDEQLMVADFQVSRMSAEDFQLVSSTEIDMLIHLMVDDGDDDGGVGSLKVHKKLFCEKIKMLKFP